MAVALAGFRDAQWAVRNSSLMVFGALVTLIVGGSAKNDLGWEGASSVEAADFFRYMHTQHLTHRYYSPHRVISMRP